ncbi:MAG: hypothetical protein IKG84_09185 [Bacteroidales bacterium]|nr:hypothetical protein [Bacteroidales bacterium]
MHQTLFPVPTFVMVAWVLFLGVAVFFFVRFVKDLIRKNRRGMLLLCFLTLLVLGAAIHVVMLSLSNHTVTEGNWIQLVLVSLVAGLEMFVGHTVVFDDIIAAVVFHEPGLLLAYLTVFVLILAFSFVLVFQMLPRRLQDRFWLSRHRRAASADRKNHVFIGVTLQAKRLAQSILREWESDGAQKDQGTVMFIDLPGKEDVHTEISIGDIFTNLVSHRKEISLDEELGSDRFVLLRGRMPASGGEESFEEAIGLRGLSDWFHNDRTSVYILGEEADNFLLVDLLLTDPGVKAKVFCLVDRMSDSRAGYSAERGRVRLIDPHQLAITQIKFQKPEWHPIHTVEIARDAEGQPLGYVESGFHALMVGFRDTAQEALRFLYEFGSFVGRNRKRVPTTFDIFDDDLDAYRGDFLVRCPGLRKDDALVWNGSAVGSDRFWQRYLEIVDTLNYVVIATGDPARDIELGVRLLETAAKSGKDLSRFLILVCANQLDERTKGVLDFYNRTYRFDGNPVLCPFGMAEAVWNLSSISGKGMKERASRFYAAFQRAIGGNDTWEKRAKRLPSRTENRMEGATELLRRQAQDLSCSSFLPSIRELAGPGLAEAAARIPNFYAGSHFPEKVAEAKHLEYLAIQSHLRWTSSHLAAGYVCGERNELLMRLPDLVDYDAVRDARSNHFDWIAVKTYLTEDIETS